MENEQQQAQIAANAAIPAPPTEAASQFVVMVTPVEMLLLVGKSRALLRQPDNAGVVGVEWLSSFSMGPLVVRQLIAALTTGMTQWEEQAKMKFPLVGGELKIMGTTKAKAVKKTAVKK